MCVCFITEAARLVTVAAFRNTLLASAQNDDIFLCFGPARAFGVTGDDKEKEIAFIVVMREGSSNEEDDEDDSNAIEEDEDGRERKQEIAKMLYIYIYVVT